MLSSEEKPILLCGAGTSSRSRAGVFPCEPLLYRTEHMHAWRTVATGTQARSIMNTRALAILAELGIYKPACRKPLI